MRLQNVSDPDDLFSDSRMPLGEHLEDLRLCLWRAIIGFGLILVLVFVLDFLGYLTDLPIGVGKPVLKLICQPVEQELHNFHLRRLERERAKLQNGPLPELPLELDLRVVAAALTLPAPAEGQPTTVTVPARVPASSWLLMQKEADRPTLRTLSVTESMMVYFKVAASCGVILGSPWIFLQLWMFVAAGLYPHERRYVHYTLPFSVGLFLTGVVVCQLLVMPKTVEALLWFNEWLGMEPELRLGEWLGFAVLMPLVFGVAFQTPLAMLVLERVGIFTVDGYRRQRRVAWFVLAIVAAVITPSTDPLSLLYLWLPVVLLYELGIALCGRWTRE
jgi:sec-independent protein translocase protein TatC